MKDEKASIASSSNPQNGNGHAATHPQNQPRPGILIVTLYEGVGFSLPDQYNQLFSTHLPNCPLQDHRTEAASFVRPGSLQQTKIVSNSHASGTRPQISGCGFDGVSTTCWRASCEDLPYAVLDFSKSQVFVDSVQGTLENPLWARDNISNRFEHRFDVYRAGELAVHLYLRHPNPTPGSGRSQDIFLGIARINPRFEESHENLKDPNLSKENEERAVAEFNQKGKTPNQSTTEWLDVQYGTGKICFGVEYIENTAWSLSIKDFEQLPVRKGSSGQVRKFMKKDTKRIYALKTIRKACIVSQSQAAHTLEEQSVLAQINNPFIVPLKFTFQSTKELYLVSPFVNSGELSYYLQKEQRFDFNRSRLYIAEILCVLEYLRSFNVIYCALKLDNILLDHLGHIALCDFDLYKLDIKDKDCTDTICGIPEYLAPELLLRQGYTETVDCWILGALLYEMLTGLPPFYDENTNEMHRRILSEPLYFPSPDVVPRAAKDILTQLLNRKPEQRLGVNGAAEIKAHPFFHGIDWCRVLERKYEPAFKPNDGQIPLSANTTWRANDNSTLSETEMRQFIGFLHDGPVARLGNEGGRLKDLSSSNFQDNRIADSLTSILDKKLSGNKAKSKFNTSTSEKDQTLAKEHYGSSAVLSKNAAVEGHVLLDEAIFTIPIATSVDAPVTLAAPTQLAAGEDPATGGNYDLSAQYVEPEAAEHVKLQTHPQEPAAALHEDKEIVEPLLPMCLRNIHDLYTEKQIQDALGDALNAGHEKLVLQLLKHRVTDLNFQFHENESGHWQSSLGWATKHENLSLIKLFLAHGADPNLHTRTKGPILLQAVEKGNPDLINAMVYKCDRVLSTKALGLAVDQQNSTIINVLLENGVKCDFEESDRPIPNPPGAGCCFTDLGNPDEYIPPLVRAVNLGNASLVQLLLAHGANVNVGYHDLRAVKTRSHLFCGRPVQLAMDLRHVEIVNFLLESGADTDLQHPVWFHDCPQATGKMRAVHLRVRAGLRAAVAARQQGTLAT